MTKPKTNVNKNPDAVDVGSEEVNESKDYNSPRPYATSEPESKISKDGKPMFNGRPYDAKAEKEYWESKEAAVTPNNRVSQRETPEKAADTGSVAADDELEWRQVPGFPHYQVSNHGDVRSDRKILLAYINPYGYKTVNLYRDRKVKNCRVHRLVLEAFVGTCPSSMVGCHNDGDRLNNHIDNLRWDTQKSNIADNFRLGVAPMGETHHSAKLDADDVRSIRQKLSERISQRVIAKEFGVNQRVIWEIKKGLIWATIQN
jgi:hypothetical protein